jgi:hypothetical protein
MSSSAYRSSKVSGGVERSFESIDVRHPIYPVALYLTRERLYNSYRHGAKKVVILFQQLKNNNFRLVCRDTSDGKADVSRLLEPAEESGMTSSQYGFGERIWRLKSSGRENPSKYAWKKAGDMFYTFLDQKDGKYQTASVNLSAEEIWTSPEEHGFYSEMEFLYDRLEGRSPEEIVPLLRSILCMTLTPAVLGTMHIRIEVRNQDGELLREHINPGKPTKSGKPRKVREAGVIGVSDSKEDKWKTLVEILEANPVEDYDCAEGVLESGANVKISYLRLKPCEGKTYYEGHKEYTEKKASAVLVQMHNFIVPIPLPEALGKAPHPASQNGRFAIIKITPPSLTDTELKGKSPLEIEHIHQKSMPTLASSKVTFLPSCPNYQEVIHFLRDSKPARWDAFIKKSSTDSESSAPSSPSTSTPVSMETVINAKLYEALVLIPRTQTSEEKNALLQAIRTYLHI